MGSQSVSQQHTARLSLRQTATTTTTMLVKVLIAMVVLVASVYATCPGACTTSPGGDCCPSVELCTSEDGETGCDEYGGVGTWPVGGAGKIYRYMKLGNEAASVILYSDVNGEGDDDERDEDGSFIDPVRFTVKSIEITE